MRKVLAEDLPEPDATAEVVAMRGADAMKEG